MKIAVMKALIRQEIAKAVVEMGLMADADLPTGLASMERIGEETMNAAAMRGGLSSDAWRRINEDPRQIPLPLPESEIPA